MMRRGDLDQYPVDWVLREAARDRVSGGIELHTPRPAVVYLKDGLVYLVLREGEQVDPIDEALDDRSYRAAVVATEIRQRAHAVEVLGEVLEVGDEGYYFHHPLNDHPLEGSWGWAPEDLLAAVEAARAPEPDDADPGDGSSEAATTPGADGGRGSGAPTGARPPEASADDRITLASSPPERTLDIDAWRALRALVPPTLQTELVGRLGGGAAAAALVDDLCARGVLQREPAGGAPGAVAAAADEDGSDADDVDGEPGDDAPDDDAVEAAEADGGEGDDDGDEDVDGQPEAAVAGGRSGRRRRWGR